MTKKNIWEKITKKDYCFIIVEAGSNHNGDFEIAKKMIDTACDSGADALDTIYSEGNKKVVVLHGGINYLLSFTNVNLRVMNTIKERLHVPIGYSDHIKGIIVPRAVVTK